MLAFSIGLDKHIFEHNIVNIVLPISLSIRFGCSKEPSHGDGSFETPQHIYVLFRNENFFVFGTRDLFFQTWEF